MGQGQMKVFFSRKIIQFVIRYCVRVKMPLTDNGLYHWQVGTHQCHVVSFLTCLSFCLDFLHIGYPAISVYQNI